MLVKTTKYLVICSGITYLLVLGSEGLSLFATNKPVFSDALQYITFHEVELIFPRVVNYAH